MTEAEFQAQVIELAGLLGWDHMHVRRSIGKGSRWTTATNVTGWPDLTMWHSRHGLLFVELKSDSGTTTREQDAVHASLRAAGQRVEVWHPDSFDYLQAVLSGKQPTEVPL